MGVCRSVRRDVEKSQRRGTNAVNSSGGANKAQALFACATVLAAWK